MKYPQQQKHAKPNPSHKLLGRRILSRSDIATSLAFYFSTFSWLTALYCKFITAPCNK